MVLRTGRANIVFAALIAMIIASHGRQRVRGFDVSNVLNFEEPELRVERDHDGSVAFKCEAVTEMRDVTWSVLAGDNADALADAATVGVDGDGGRLGVSVPAGQPAGRYTLHVVGRDAANRVVAGSVDVVVEGVPCLHPIKPRVTVSPLQRSAHMSVELINCGPFSLKTDLRLETADGKLIVEWKGWDVEAETGPVSFEETFTSPERLQHLAEIVFRFAYRTADAEAAEHSSQHTANQEIISAPARFSRFTVSGLVGLAVIAAAGLAVVVGLVSWNAGESNGKEQAGVATPAIVPLVKLVDVTKSHSGLELSLTNPADHGSADLRSIESALDPMTIAQSCPSALDPGATCTITLAPGAFNLSKATSGDGTLELDFTSTSADRSTFPPDEARTLDGYTVTRACEGGGPTTECVVQIPIPTTVPTTVPDTLG
jgi:hypothetical protein